MTIGYTDLKAVLRLPQDWDADYLSKWRLADRVTWSEVITRIGTALVLFNRSLTDPNLSYWARYFSTTTEAAARYGVGATGEMTEMTDHGRPDPQGGAVTGHMLPLRDYGAALGWTRLALERANSAQIEADINALIVRARNTWEKKLLTRLFKSTYDSVGSTGKSVPFADGGTADSEYVPQSYNGQDFSSSHTHFLRYAADATGRTNALKAMATHLLEHGFMSPFELVVAEADKSLWAAQTEFIKPERSQLITAGVSSRANIGETYMGALETDDAVFLVKPTSRVPTTYAGAYAPRGAGTPDNTLIVRTDPNYQLGVTIVAEGGVHPFQDAIAQFSFGVGVDNRVSGVATYFYSSGDYVSPTIA